MNGGIRYEYVRIKELLLALVASHAALPPDPEDYWKSALPNTPVPKAVKDILHTEVLEDKSTSVVVRKDAVDLGTSLKVAFAYVYAATKDQLHDNPNVALFFLEKNMHKGTKTNLHFIKTRRKSVFLPHLVAESIPFASEKMPEILNKFSVSPNSMETKAMKKTIKQCEEPGIKGEEQYCATR
ncbi:unnamed protein product [Ilex paraguariensis]|uniref:BURP domain-containing protein n=1 Tax=Ilex paraguariensis TaxID=185542 RepID=A0ABC8TU72_9AQUA